MDRSANQGYPSLSATALSAGGVVTVSTDTGFTALGKREGDGLLVAVWLRYRIRDGRMILGDGLDYSERAEDEAHARRDLARAAWREALERGRTWVRLFRAEGLTASVGSYPLGAFGALHDGEAPRLLAPGATIAHLAPTGGVTTSVLSPRQPFLALRGEIHLMSVVALDLDVRQSEARVTFATNVALGADERTPADLRVTFEDEVTAVASARTMAQPMQAQPANEMRRPAPAATVSLDVAGASSERRRPSAVTGAMAAVTAPAMPFAPSVPSSRPPSTEHRPSFPPPAPPPSPPPPPPSPRASVPASAALGSLESSQWRPRPPNPLADDVGRGATPAPAPAMPAPAPIEEKAPLPSHGVELVWWGDDLRALNRARAWARPRRTKGLVPRVGGKALRQEIVAPHAWLADGRCADPEELLAPELLFTDEGGSLEVAAVVVKGTLAFDVAPHEELEALRLAVRHLASRHKAVRSALETTAEIPAQPLTPIRLLHAGIDELVEGLDRAGVGGTATRATARQSLLRSRRYSVLDVLGGDHLVARWTPPGGGDAWAAYLPLEARSFLPLEASFAIRAAVTVHPRQDPNEQGPRALRIHALARVLATEALSPQPASNPPPRGALSR